MRGEGAGRCARERDLVALCEDECAYVSEYVSGVLVDDLSGDSL